MPRKLLLIFLLALSVRVLFFSITAAGSSGTFNRAVLRFDGYYEIAENILAGNGFSRSLEPPFIPDSVRTPLYPLFLAGVFLLFKSYYAAIIIQIIIGSFIPILAYRLAMQFLKNAGLATFIAVLLSFEPLTVHLSSTLQTETFFTALFLGGLTLFLDYWNEQRARILIYAAILLALATLARPTIQFLPLLLVAAISFLAKGRVTLAVSHSLIIATVFILILAPWSVRNFLRFKNPALTVQYASVPYGFLIPSAIALEERIGFREAQQKFNDGIGAIKDIEDITLENAPYYKKRTVELLKEHPVGLIKSIGVTTFTFFTHDGYLDVLARLHLDPTLRLERPAFTLLFESPKEALSLIASLAKSPALLIILGRIFWIFVSLCFIIGAIRLLKNSEHRAKSIFVLLLVAYFVFTTVAVGLAVNARFRMPVNAIILTLAMYGAFGLLPSHRTFPSLITREEANPAIPALLRGGHDCANSERRMRGCSSSPSPNPSYTLFPKRSRWYSLRRSESGEE